MVKVVSKVSKTLARREVLMAPGGKGEFRKYAKGGSRPTCKLANPTTDRKAIKWIKVSAPAYISGSLRKSSICTPPHASVTTSDIYIYIYVYSYWSVPGLY